jgi:hypothetical protein
MTAVQLWGRVTVVGPDGTEQACYPLAGPGNPDLAAVDTVARLALLARRRGDRIVLAELSPALRDLLDLAGLIVEVQRKPERREQPLGIQEREEEMQPGDLPA